MPDAKPMVEPMVPLDVQAEIRRQIRDIVERYGGRRPAGPLRRPPSFPSPAEPERGENQPR